MRDASQEHAGLPWPGCVSAEREPTTLALPTWHEVVGAIWIVQRVLHGNHWDALCVAQVNDGHLPVRLVREHARVLHHTVHLSHDLPAQHSQS